jgi:hypothetical protein
MLSITVSIEMHLEEQFSQFFLKDIGPAVEVFILRHM